MSAPDREDSAERKPTIVTASTTPPESNLETTLSPRLSILLHVVCTWLEANHPLQAADMGCNADTPSGFSVWSLDRFGVQRTIPFKNEVIGGWHGNHGVTSPIQAKPTQTHNPQLGDRPKTKSGVRLRPGQRQQRVPPTPQQPRSQMRDPSLSRCSAWSVDSCA